MTTEVEGEQQQANQSGEPAVIPESVASETVAPDLTAELEKWKALSRKNEQRAKDNEAAAKRLAEIEEASKTELEKAQARAERAEQLVREREEADKKAQEEADRRAAVAAWAKEVSEATGVPSAALHGTTREEIQAVADELKPHFPEKPVGSTAGVGGHRGVPIGEGELTAEEIVAKATAR